MAAHTPDANFLAVDIKNEMLALCKRAADRAYAEAGRDPSNLRITAADIEHIDTVLAPPDHVAQLHIQFPNPWPKPSHRKRRLTHTRQLQLYRPFLDADSRIFIKTDDAPLYHDTLRYLGEAGFEIISATDDLYRDGVPNGALLTEHERMFLADGLKICSIEARMI